MIKVSQPSIWPKLSQWEISGLGCRSHGDDYTEDINNQIFTNLTQTCTKKGEK